MKRVVAGAAPVVLFGAACGSGPPESATADPGWDSVAAISAYVQAFVADRHGPRTEDDAEPVCRRRHLRRFPRKFRRGCRRRGPHAPPYAVDDAGRLRVTRGLGIEPEGFAAELRILLHTA